MANGSVLGHRQPGYANWSPLQYAPVLGACITHSFRVLVSPQPGFNSLMLDDAHIYIYQWTLS